MTIDTIKGEKVFDPHDPTVADQLTILSAEQVASAQSELKQVITPESVALALTGSFGERQGLRADKDHILGKIAASEELVRNAKAEQHEIVSGASKDAVRTIITQRINVARQQRAA